MRFSEAFCKAYLRSKKTLKKVKKLHFAVSHIKAGDQSKQHFFDVTIVTVVYPRTEPNFSPSSSLKRVDLAPFFKQKIQPFPPRIPLKIRAFRSSERPKISLFQLAFQALTELERQKSEIWCKKCEKWLVWHFQPLLLQDDHLD